MAPHTLEQTSLTIKFNPFVCPPPILSPHQYLNFVYSLSLMQRHPVTSLGWHVCHITTFRMHFSAYSALMHTPSQHLHMLVHLVMRVPRHHHLHMHVCVQHSHWHSSQHSLTHVHAHMQTCLAFHISILVFTFWFAHIDSHTSGMGSHSTRNIILPLFQEFSRNVLQSHSQCMADITVCARLNMRPHHLFSLSSLSQRREGWVRELLCWCFVVLVIFSIYYFHLALPPASFTHHLLLLVTLLYHQWSFLGCGVLVWPMSCTCQ